MTHYVCTGNCGGVSDHEKNCDTQSCSRFGQPLKECHCQDGKHEEVFQKQDTQQDKQ